MIPIMCRVKHEPENGTYGDCLRACIASLMDDQSEGVDVPHFVGDDAPNDVVLQRLRDWLSEQGFAPFFVAYPGEFTASQVRQSIGIHNPGIHYLLFGQTEDGGDHVVVCLDDALAHDPAWVCSPMASPTTSGFWSVMVIARP